MMALVVENAGAQTGVLLLKRDSDFTVEAETRPDSDEVTVLNAMAFKDADLPRSIIRFVERFSEPIVLDDAANEERFADDDYIRYRQPKSVLCMPIMHQNTLMGILYAENNLVYGGFTRQRLEALRVISSQAAIALENAMLYEDLEARVQQRTAELENSLNDLRAAQKKLVESEKMASLGGLVAGVAHEVNTPIGVSVTAASFLQEKTEAISNQSAPAEADWAKYLQTAKDSTQLILTNLQRAADLVKSFKQVAVDQSAEKRRTFNVSQYIDEILVSMGPRFKRTQHEVTVNCPENLEIDSFPGAFAQVVTNLVMNSLVHGFEDIEQGRITIDVYPEKEGIRLQYRDNGRGMDENSAARVFEPFFTTRRAHGGAGLGMHVVYNIVTQTLGGTVECQSAPGDGVTFDFYLPGNGGGSAKETENRDHP